MMTLARVDFPAPLGPMRAWTSPALTTRSTPRKMAAPSASTWRFLSSSRGVVTGDSLLGRPKVRYLPASGDPLIEVGLFDADGGGGTVAGPHDGLRVVGAKEPLLDRSDDGREVAALEFRRARPAGEKGVAADEDWRVHEGEADRPRRVAGRVDGAQPQVAD